MMKDNLKLKHKYVTDAEEANKDLITGDGKFQASLQTRVNAFRTMELGFKVLVPSARDLNSEYMRVQGKSVVMIHKDFKESNLVFPSHIIKQYVSRLIFQQTSKLLYTEPNLSGPLNYYLALLAKYDSDSFLSIVKEPKAQKPHVRLDRLDTEYINSMFAMNKNYDAMNFQIGNLYLLNQQIQDTLSVYSARAQGCLDRYEQIIKMTVPESEINQSAVKGLKSLKEDLRSCINMTPETYFKAVCDASPDIGASKYRLAPSKALQDTKPDQADLDQHKKVIAGLFSQSVAGSVFVKPEFNAPIRKAAMVEYCKNLSAKGASVVKVDVLKNLIANGVVVKHSQGKFIEILFEAKAVLLMKNLTDDAKEFVYQKLEAEERQKITTAAQNKLEVERLRRAKFDGFQRAIIEGVFTESRVNEQNLIDQFFGPGDFDEQSVGTYMALKKITDLEKTFAMQQLIKAVSSFVESKFDALYSSPGFLMYNIKKIREKTGRVGVAYDEYLQQLKYLVVEVINSNRKDLYTKLDEAHVIGSTALINQIADSVVTQTITSVKYRDPIKKVLLQYGIEYYREQIDLITQDVNNTNDLAVARVFLEVAEQKRIDDVDAAIDSMDQISRLDLKVSDVMRAKERSGSVQTTGSSAILAQNFELQLVSAQVRQDRLEKDLVTSLLTAIPNQNVQDILQNPSSLCVALEQSPSAIVLLYAKIKTYCVKDDLASYLMYGVCQALLSLCGSRRAISDVICFLKCTVEAGVDEDSRYEYFQQMSPTLQKILMMCCFLTNYARLASAINLVKDKEVSLVALTNFFQACRFVFSHDLLSSTLQQPEVIQQNLIASFQYLLSVPMQRRFCRLNFSSADAVKQFKLDDLLPVGDENRKQLEQSVYGQYPRISIDDLINSAIHSTKTIEMYDFRLSESQVIEYEQACGQLDCKELSAGLRSHYYKRLSANQKAAEEKASRQSSNVDPTQPVELSNIGNCCYQHCCCHTTDYYSVCHTYHKGLAFEDSRDCCV